MEIETWQSSVDATFIKTIMFNMTEKMMMMMCSYMTVRNKFVQNLKYPRS